MPLSHVENGYSTRAGLKNVAQFERALKVDTLTDKRLALKRFYPWLSRNYLNDVIRLAHIRHQVLSPRRTASQIDQLGQLQQLLHWPFSSPLTYPPESTSKFFFQFPALIF